MIITVIAVRVMQVPVNKVVNMIAVGHCGMAAVRPVHVVTVVPLAVMRAASVRIGV